MNVVPGAEALALPIVAEAGDVTLTLKFDMFARETTWEITSGRLVVRTGGPYLHASDGSTRNIPMNLAPGSYELTVSDSWGDGMCCRWGEGSVSLTWPDGNWTSGRTFTGNQISKAFKIADNGGGGRPENRSAGPDLDRDGTVDELDDDIDGDGIRNRGDSDTLNDYEPVTVMYQGNGNPYFEIRKTGDAFIGSSPEIASGDRVWLRKDQPYYCYLRDSQGGARITVTLGKYSVFVPLVDKKISRTDPLPGHATTRGAWINLSPVTVTWQPKAEAEGRDIEDWVVPDDYSNLITSTDPQYLSGLRYFPGGTLDDQSRVFTNVNVRISVPFFAGGRMRLKAFDVDDPTPIPDVDDDNRGFDNRVHGILSLYDANFTGRVWWGEKIYQNFGNRWIIVDLDEDGEALVELRTHKFPGNNYRVIAHPDEILNEGFRAFGLDDGYYYVGPNDKPLRGLRHGGISRTLTIWRKLHLEYDSMALSNLWLRQAVYTKVEKASFHTPAPNRNELFCSRSLPLPENYFGHGFVNLLDGTTWGQPRMIWRSDPFKRRYVYFRDPMEFNRELEGKWIRIAEDDDTFMSYHNLPPTLPMNHNSDWLTEKMAPEFALAYIQLIDLNAEGHNPNQLIPFKLHWHPRTFWGYYPFDDDQDVTNRSSFWAHTVVFAYQPTEDEDKDPDNERETRGLTVTGPRIDAHSMIFMETIRDNLFSQDNFIWAMNRENYEQGIETRRQHYFNTIPGVTAHEIAHGPSRGARSDHDEGGLMGDWNNTGLRGLDFSAKTIKRFRSAHSWEEAQD